MKTLDPENIHEVTGPFVSGGLVQLKSNHPFSLMAEKLDGTKVLMFHGDECDVKIRPGTIMTCEGKGKVYGFMPEPEPYKPTGEVYSNADEMPMGGSYDAVAMAVRQVQLEKRAMLRTIRAERKKLNDVLSANQDTLAKINEKTSTQTPEAEPENVSGKSEESQET